MLLSGKKFTCWAVNHKKKPLNLVKAQWLLNFHYAKLVDLAFIPYSISNKLPV